MKWICTACGESSPCELEVPDTVDVRKCSANCAWALQAANWRKKDDTQTDD